MRRLLRTAAIALPIISLYVLCTVFGFFDLYVGGVDSLHAPQMSSRVAGAIIAFSGCNWLIIALTIARQKASSWLFFSLPAASISGSIFLSSQLSSYEYDWKLAVWLLAAATPWIALFRMIAKGVLVLSIRFHVSKEMVAGAFTLVAAFVALAPNVLPGHGKGSDPLGIALHVSSAIVGQVTAEHGSYDEVRTTYHLENLSSAPTIVLGSYYELFGVSPKIGAAPSPVQFDEQFQDRLVMSDGSSTSGWAALYEHDDTYTVVESGRSALGDGTLIDAHATVDGFVTSLVPHHAYHQFIFAIRAVTARASRATVHLQDFTQPLQLDVPDKFAYADLHVDETHLKRVTWGERFIEVQYPLGHDALRSLTNFGVIATSVDRRGQPYNSFNDRLASTYGLSVTGASASLVVNF